MIRKKRNVEKKAKKKGGFIWLTKWPTETEGEYNFLNLPAGVELRCLKTRLGTNEVSLFLFSLKFEEGRRTFSLEQAFEKYPFLKV